MSAVPKGALPRARGSRVGGLSFGTIAVITMSVVMCVVLLSAPAAGANSISVSTRTDEVSPTDGLCSLREAVTAANTSKASGGVAGECPAGAAGANTIVLAGGAPYALTLASGGALQVKSELTISGDGAASTTIDGGGVDRVLDVGAATAFVTGVTITGGRAPDGTASVRGGGLGGGIRNGGVLTLTDATVVGNRAGDAKSVENTLLGVDGAAGGSGGGIYNAGTLFLVRTTVAKNIAGNGGTGGFHSPPAPPGVGGAGGPGGGVVNAAGATLSVIDSSITGNHAGAGGAGGDTGFGGTSNGAVGGAGGAGGGLWNAGTLSLTTSAVTGNVAGRAGNGGSNRLMMSTSGGGPGGTGGSGGGLFDNSAVSQTISNSTIGANFAGAGGDGTLGGYGGDGGGGGGVVSANAALALVSMTVSANAVGLGGGNGGGGPGGSGGGGGINAFGSAALQDTIVAGNSGGNCLGAMTDGGHDLSYPDATCPGANGDPKLGAPQDNGGPTATAALAAGSAAIDQVPASGAGCPTTDQRGTPRPQGPACDIGAFELGRAPSNTAPPSISGSPAVGQTLGCANGMWSNAPLSYAYLWLRNGTGIPGATTSTHQVLTADAAHHLSCRVTATNPTGSVSADSAALNVPAQSGRGNNAIASKLSVSPAAFTAAGSGPSATTVNRNRAKRPKSGATVSYTLNVPAVVRFTVRQRVPGRTQGRRKTARCVAQTKRNRKTRKCTRTMTLPGAFTRSGNSAVNRFHFSGRLNGHKLKPGTYTLVANPTTSRHPSRAPTVTFRIIR